ncbi:MAG TPA: hypothetical protein PLH12_08580 [Pseudomonadales bacterium]|nr:hypothetical protein [Pseudomonadales bacterium]
MSVSIDKIPVFYTPKMLAPSLSFSPSSMKPEKVVAAWQALSIPIEVIEPKPATVDEFALAHDRTFVERVLAGEANNGVSNMDMTIARTLPYTSGSMRDAAFAALKNGAVAVSPTSGFHHAHWKFASGFCTFNGLMIAARCLLVSGKVKRVGIVDCDFHYGNGTDDIIAKLKLTHEIKHFTQGESFNTRSRGKVDDFFEALEEHLHSMADCDVVLYQAGADPHMDDPLGGFLTTSQLRDRDLLVFKKLRQYGVPVAWNLAGGYQQLASTGETDWAALTEIHSNTLKACWKVFG